MNINAPKEYPKKGITLPKKGELKKFKVSYSERRMSGKIRYSETVEATNASEAKKNFQYHSEVKVEEL